MAMPALFQHLRLPAIAAPMFLTSGPDLVVEVCRSGLVGTFPALNQRSTAAFASSLANIEDRLVGCPYGRVYGVNLIVHKSNPRLTADLAEVVRRKVPLVITSLGAVRDVVDAVHSYGGLVFHDVIGRGHAEKAADAGGSTASWPSVPAQAVTPEPSRPSRSWLRSEPASPGRSRCQERCPAEPTSPRLVLWASISPTWAPASSPHGSPWSARTRSA